MVFQLPIIVYEIIDLEISPLFGINGTFSLVWQDLFKLVL